MEGKTIFEETGFIAVFLVVCAFIYITLGDGVLYRLLWVVLIGQIITNWQTIDKEVKGALQ